MTNPIGERILSWFRAGIAEVDPIKVTSAALRDIDPGSGQLVVLSIGKAAVAMATAARDVFGDRIDSGLLVAKDDQVDAEVDGFLAMEASHPIPDERSLRAGEKALEMVSALSADDTVIALVSGGGSSLIERPVEGISLMDMQATTELLMYAGAGIHELNTVRKALSAIKGGGLRREIGDARTITLMLSDVLGNDHAVIASGPTVPSPTSRRPALQVIEDFKIQDQIPHSVIRFLSADMPPSPGTDTSRDERRIIADNAKFVGAVHSAAESESLRTQVVIENWRDDVADLTDQVLESCRSANPEVDVLIGGGEATSIVKGSGRGGRNTETALRVAIQFQTNEEWTFASLASDGDDGNSGAAGAIVNSSAVDDPNAARKALESSDSAGYLDSRNALVRTGQTGTNVNDVYIAVRNSAITGETT